MSGLDRWLEVAQSKWRAIRVHVARFSPVLVDASLLASEDVIARWRAVRALAGRARPPLLPRLIELTGDADAMVRAAAEDALVSWGPAAALEPVRQALAQTPPPRQTAALLAVLARLPDPANRAIILPWLDHEDEGVRAAALMALAALCDDEDLLTLQRALKEGHREIQRAIFATLCAPGAESLARQALDARDPALSQRAQQALARIQRAQPTHSPHSTNTHD
ncbi:MAG TPA: HEAT repeat domain-containing protein [Caldilineales bacterium]|nr:HEAT repeat domain-containing protein [Caldilineales bacterium]